MKLIIILLLFIWPKNDLATTQEDKDITLVSEYIDHLSMHNQTMICILENFKGLPIISIPYQCHHHKTLISLKTDTKLHPVMPGEKFCPRSLLDVDRGLFYLN